MANDFLVPDRPLIGERLGVVNRGRRNAWAIRRDAVVSAAGPGLGGARLNARRAGLGLLRGARAPQLRS